MWLIRVFTLVACLVLGGCQQPVAGGDQQVVAGGDVPVTPQALAWVTAEHFGPPTHASPYPAASRRIGVGAVATGLSYDEAIVVAVVPSLGMPVCGATPLRADACLETGAGFLAWDLAVEGPEGEDPGLAYVLVPKADSWAIVISSGPGDINDDPRRLDLAIGVNDMFELANDPRVDLTTTQAAVDGGEELGYWGQPDL